jgi:hypothetical protein
MSSRNQAAKTPEKEYLKTLLLLSQSQIKRLIAGLSGSVNLLRRKIFRALILFVYFGLPKGLFHGGLSHEP